MKIRPTLLIGIAASIVISAFITSIVFLILQDISKEVERGRIYDRVINKTHGINLLLASYKSEPGTGYIRQVIDARRSLEKILSEMSSSDSPEISLVKQIRANNQDIGYSLEQLITPAGDVAGIEEVERRNILVSQLWLKTQFIFEDTRKLVDISQSRLESSQGKAVSLVIVLIISLVGINAAISFLSGRSIERAEAKTREHREWLRVTLSSIGDAVLTTDTAGNITFLNPIAAAITGWSLDEANGQPVQSIFRILNEMTRKPAEDIVGRVLREGYVVSLANHTALIARDGAEIPIEDSAAPIRDSSENIIGVVLVFHDVTEKRRAQEALRQRDEEFRALVENAPDVISLFDQDLRRVYVNSEVSENTGRDASFIMGKSLTEAGYPDSFSQPLNAAIQKVFATGNEEKVELDYEAPKGPIWLQIRCAPLRDADGSVERVMSIGRDITERKQAEEAMRLHLSVMETVSEGIFLIGVDDNSIKWTNRRFEEMFGYDPGEMIGMHVDVVNAPTDKTPAEIRESIVELLLRQGEYHGEIQNIRKDGTAFWCHIHVSLFDHPEFGRVMVSAHTDITERKTIEDELREANNQSERRAIELESLMDAVPAMIWISRDPECLSMTGNRAVYDFLGMPLGTNVSKTAPPSQQPLHFRALNKGKEIPLDELPMQKAAKGQGVQDYELEYAFENGSSRITLGNTTPLRDSNGSVYGAIAAFIDITERKRMEEELRESHNELEMRVRERTAELSATVERLELINKELQDFAFVASHDLQEPLRKIQTFCGMTMKNCAPALSDSGKEYLDRVVKSAERMRQLLRDLLQFSRVATRPEVFETLNLGSIVRVAADYYEPSILEADARIEIEEMPAIEGDEIQILQLFQNLIGNALKYRSIEAPRIRIYSGSYAPERCEIFMEDNGIGFNQEYSDLIFKPFQRLHGRGQYDGTGMGLAICRKIVERHGGTMKAKSEPGKGSIFIINLPLKQSKPETGIATAGF